MRISRCSNSRILLISGRANSGKDTFYKLLSEEFNLYKTERVAFADSLKILAKNYGWNGSKDGEDRFFLIDIGQILRDDYQVIKGRVFKKSTSEEVMRSSYNIYKLYKELERNFTFNKNFWVDIVKDKILIDSVPEQALYYCITDWRFPNEYERLSLIFDRIIKIRVNREAALDIKDESETQLDNYNFDIVIDNNEDFKSYQKKISDSLSNFTSF